MSMKVKVGNKWYDSQETPIMIVLTDKDKENIANMLPDAYKYCCAPEEMKRSEIYHFMHDQDF